MNEFQTIEWKKQNGVAHITLNRPDNANSVNLLLAQELMEAANTCDCDPEIRAVLLTGKGRMFSAGGDLPSFIDKGDAAGQHLKDVTAALHTASSRFARMAAPLIVAVNGTAAGAGFSLAVSGDIVFAAESAKFTLAYTGVALSPDGGSSYYLPRLVGLRRAQELILTNRVLSAQEALEWGLLTKVVADDELQSEALAMAERMANGPTQAYGQSKALLLDTYNNNFETQLELESRSIAKLINSPDGQEGIHAFAEKRKPAFKG